MFVGSEFKKNSSLHLIWYIIIKIKYLNKEDTKWKKT